MSHDSQCIYCGSAADLLCDFVIGFDDPDGDGLYSSLDHEIFRCDAPLCRCHARSAGQIFFPAGLGGMDTIDHCHTHPAADLFRALGREDATRQRQAHRWFYESRRNHAATQPSPAKSTKGEAT